MMGNKRYTDLLNGSVTFNCLAKNGLVAENIAHTLFAGITGYKDQFKKNGINTITNIQIGEENILKSDSSIELTAIPIYIQFTTQKSLSTGIDYNTIDITDAEGKAYYQGSDYRVEENRVIWQYTVDIGTIFTVTYTRALTLEETTETITIDDTNREGFELLYIPYSPYYGFSGVNITASGVSW